MAGTPGGVFAFDMKTPAPGSVARMGCSTCDVRGSALRGMVVDLPWRKRLQQKRGIPVIPISAQAFTCMLMSWRFNPHRLPRTTGYVRGSAGDQTCQPSPAGRTSIWTCYN